MSEVKVIQLKVTIIECPSKLHKRNGQFISDFIENIFCLMGTNIYIIGPGHVTKMVAMSMYGKNHKKILLQNCVCVEVLGPSQPTGVMSSVVSLPNHTFTGQA